MGEYMLKLIVLCLALGSCQCASQKDLLKCQAENELLTLDLDQMATQCSELWVTCQALYEECSKGNGPPADEAANR